MKKVAVIVFVLALAGGLMIANFFSVGASAPRFFNFSFNFKGVKGSGTPASEARELKDFKRVDVGGVFQVEITAQREFAVEVEADDNLLQHIRTEVRNGTLHISTERKISPSNQIKVRVWAPDIDDLDISGVANVTLTDVKNSALNIDSSGASKVSVAGKTNKLTVDVSGATKINAEELATVDANIDASGASHVFVNVSGELRGDASGASKITYSGSPSSIVRNTSGASKIVQK